MDAMWLLVSCAWKAALVVALGAALLRMGRSASAAERHAVWAAVIVALLALPVLSVLWSRVPLALAGEGSVAQQALMMADGYLMVTVLAGNGDSAVAGMRWVWMIWMLGVVATLVRLLLGYAFAYRYLRGSKPLVIGESWWRGRAPILVSPTAPVPMAVGILRPTVVLPSTAVRWDAQLLRRVLIHEAEHIRRKDPLWKLLASVTASLYWFHPLVWVVMREFATERELACDDAVLAAGGKPSQYASDLVEFAKKSMAWSVRATVIPMASPTRLELRIEAILNESKPRQVFRRTTVMMYTIVLALLLLPLSALQSAAAANPTPRSDATPAAVAQPAAQSGEEPGVIDVSGSVQARKLIKKVNPRYPAEAKAEGVKGLVRIKVRINKEGAVAETEVEQSPDARLSTAAVNAVKQWVYEPTLLNGKPVEVLATIDVNFSLK
ncbi:MAG: M56 family metallopeptidase [Bryobacterales bacterium]|nr:M56 family metallopeptidase [Bryobacterales bacterium]